MTTAAERLPAGVRSLDERADRDLDMVESVANSAWCIHANSKNAPTHQEEKPPRKVVAVDAAGLLSASFPPRDKLLKPWLSSQSLAMIYAPRGIGKTHMALGVAYALASGGEFLGWQATAQTPVLYLDGEMPGADLKARVATVIASNEREAADGYLRFVTPDLQADGVMPNLYQPEGREAVNAALGNARVIIVDNLSCLVRGGKENEGESWQPVQEWALQMRSQGLSVVFVHHAGKGGQQRGTSKREDVLDTVIALRKPADYEPGQGARFEVHFEKARALYGQDVSPFEAALTTLPDGNQTWATRAVSDASEEQMIELAGLGLSTREIGGELGVNHSTVVRALNKAKDAGRYTPKPKRKTKPTPKKGDSHDD
ncbi:AAA family ATPase [Rhodanobacter sp. OK091]|uniref:AAA family ATPase n=1 Tax=Rhodanobacter sp. OK091 TaxID=1881037 RepID=UPI00091B7727|nr:AAA family ATPase [Rhodanobacter sp. OK091]SHM18693.1 AAA domain-containing protein [Rhodanobacter sp. OK091]